MGAGRVLYILTNRKTMKSNVSQKRFQNGGGLL